jgi:hypothetical protein
MVPLKVLNAEVAVLPIAVIAALASVYVVISPSAAKAEPTPRRAGTARAIFFIIAIL